MTRYRLPPEAMNQHVAVLGKTGSGKTYAAKTQIEPLLDDGRQVAIIDPTDAWWGLRSSQDGKAAGFPILVLGGEHGDMPLPAMGGAAVARLVTEQRVSVILATSHMTVGERSRWFTDFATTLYRTIKSPLHLVIDEAHNFMPQGRIPDPEAGKMLHAGNQIMSGGRSRGIRGILITQRPAKLHKDSLTCADTLIAMRVIAPQDRQAIKDWIDGAGDAKDGKQVLDSLASLAKGEGWVWFPEGKVLERVKFPKITTFDSSATPSDGQTIAAPKRTAEIDLTEIRKALDLAAKEAEANDPKLLRQKVAELTKQLAAKAPVTMDAAATQRAIERATNDRDKFWQREMAQLRQKQMTVGKLPGILRDAAATIERVASMTEVVVKVPPGEVRKLEYVSKPVSFAVRTPSSNGDHRASDLPGPHQKIIDSLAWWDSVGIRSPSAAQVAFVAGYSPGTGTLNTYFGAMNTGGLIVRDNGIVRLTDSGRSAANTLGGTATLDELHDKIRSVLEGPHRKLLDEVIKAGPDGETPAATIAQGAGYAPGTGTINTYFGRLTTLGLIERRSGIVRPTKVLFPEGLT